MIIIYSEFYSYEEAGEIHKSVFNKLDSYADVWVSSAPIADNLFYELWKQQDNQKSIGVDIIK